MGEVLLTAAMRCRHCGGALDPVLDLGEQPPAGHFPLIGAPAVPMEQLLLTVCARCSLCQLAFDGPDEYDDPAAPPPTSSATIGEHARRFVGSLVDAGVAGPERRILELASHGGYLSPFFSAIGLETILLETRPERAARMQAVGGSVAIHAGLGTDQSSGEPDLGAFDLVVDNYLLSHLPRPGKALATLTGLVASGGWLVLEFDHLLPTVLGIQFDAIRHGHRSYLTFTWLRRALRELGFDVVRAEPQPVYGGALRVWARRAPAKDHPDVQWAAVAESKALIDRASGFEPFVAGVERIRGGTIAHLEDRRAAGRPVVGYGAPARAVTFLNALRIGPDLLPVTADRAVSKQGRVIPGVEVPIVAPEALRDRPPGDVLVLSWDLAGEIRVENEWIHERGGRMLVAVPELAVV